MDATLYQTHVEHVEHVHHEEPSVDKISARESLKFEDDGLFPLVDEVDASDYCFDATSFSPGGVSGASYSTDMDASSSTMHYDVRHHFVGNGVHAMAQEAATHAPRTSHSDATTATVAAKNRRRKRKRLTETAKRLKQLDRLKSLNTRNVQLKQQLEVTRKAYRQTMMTIVHLATSRSLLSRQQPCAATSQTLSWSAQGAPLSMDTRLPLLSG